MLDKNKQKLHQNEGETVILNNDELKGFSKTGRIMLHSNTIHNKLSILF